MPSCAAAFGTKFSFPSFHWHGIQFLIAVIRHGLCSIKSTRPQPFCPTRCKCFLAPKLGLLLSRSTLTTSGNKYRGGGWGWSVVVVAYRYFNAGGVVKRHAGFSPESTWQRFAKGQQYPPCTQGHSTTSRPAFSWSKSVLGHTGQHVLLPSVSTISHGHVQCVRIVSGFVGWFKP